MLQSGALTVPLSAGHLLEWPVEFLGWGLAIPACVVRRSCLEIFLEEEVIAKLITDFI